MKFYKLNSALARNLMVKKVVGNADYILPEVMPYYKLLVSIFYDLENFYINPDELVRYGIDNKEESYLLSTGFIKEVNVPKNEAIRISLKNKHSRDSLFAANIALTSKENLKKARKAWSSSYRDSNKMRNTIKKAKKEQLKEVRWRRKVLKKMIIEEYGELPVKIPINEVKDLISKYPRVIWCYPENDHKKYERVRRDLISLGIDTECRNESISKALRKKIKEDPVYRQSLCLNAMDMNRKRKELYQEHPELKTLAEIISANTRKKMMRIDKKFRENTLGNLAKGNPAMWNKYREDETFRGKVYKQQLRNLKKGTKTVKKRAKKRREALMRRIILPYSVDVLKAKPKQIIKLLDEKYSNFREKHYRNMSLERAIKRDISELRKDFKSSSF